MLSNIPQLRDWTGFRENQKRIGFALKKIASAMRELFFDSFENPRLSLMSSADSSFVFQLLENMRDVLKGIHHRFDAIPVSRSD
jgi:hypothetical protein